MTHHHLKTVREALERIKRADKGTLLNGSVRVYYISNNLETRIDQALTALDELEKGLPEEIDLSAMGGKPVYIFQWVRSCLYGLVEPQHRPYCSYIAGDIIDAVRYCGGLPTEKFPDRGWDKKLIKDAPPPVTEKENG